VSNDAGVSFQTPTKISPEAAPMMVMSHEQEHVNREQVKAQKEGKKVVFQAIRISTNVCSECQRVYVSGGVTETVTASAEKKDPFNYGGDSMIGGSVNTVI
jgi:aspartate-semialdehyde dehydrogenase